MVTVISLTKQCLQWAIKVYQDRYGLLVFVITVAAIFSLPASAIPAKSDQVIRVEEVVSPPTIQTAALAPSVDTLTAKTPEYVILQPIDEATFSSETTASVESIPVKEGTYFKKDDVLLKLDCRVQQAELKQAVAQQKSTEMALKSAQRLKAYGSISEFELVKANSEAEVADAEAAKLQAIVDKCVIKAPYNGAVANVMVHAHESVKPGDPLMKIVNTENIIVELEVPSSWLSWLTVGDIFNVYINEVDKSIPTTIIRINPAIEPISQTVKIVGEVSDTKDKLLPGMSGQATFPSDPANHIVKTIGKSSVNHDK